MRDINEKGRDLGGFSVNNVNEKEWTAGTSGNAQRQEAEYLHKRTTGRLWATLVALAVALSLVAAYDYSIFQRHNAQLTQLSGLVDAFAGMGKRLDTAEATLRAWTADRDSLFERLRKLDYKVNSDFRLARKHAEELTAQLEERVQDQIDEREYLVDARLSKVESNQEANGARLAQLQEEIANFRQEIAAVRRDTGRDLANLSQKQIQSQGKLEAIVHQLDRQRVDFEVAKNDTQELVPGISLRVLRTNVSYQRFEGWLWFLADQRTLWIENQGAQQPVMFRGKQGGEPYELVVTGVNKKGVVGYLLLPVSGSTPEGMAATAEARAIAAPPPAF